MKKFSLAEEFIFFSFCKRLCLWDVAKFYAKNFGFEKEVQEKLVNEITILGQELVAMADESDETLKLLKDISEM